LESVYGKGKNGSKKRPGDADINNFWRKAKDLFEVSEELEIWAVVVAQW